MKIEASKSPQDISEDEADLGFQKLVIQGMEPAAEIGHLFQAPVSPVLVACILSSYEILLKILDLEGGVEYSHLQFGSFTIAGGENMEDEPDWSPVDVPCKDAAMFLQEYGVGIHKTHGHPINFFSSVEFKYRKS
jgi:hypothetical protein